MEEKDINKLINARESVGSLSRDKKIIRTSITGIIVNVLLSAFKAVIGFISGSIAIVLDAVNNISDAASSLITIIGTWYARKPADRKHPFGHGRAEYLSAMIISVIILYAGITSLVESVKKIITPQALEYTIPGVIIIGVAIFAKIFLGRYFVSTGKKVNSDSLVNSGEDATMDAVISAATFVAALIYMIWGVSIEAWLAAVISVYIIKSGIGMLAETLSRILGERTEPGLAKAIKATVSSFPDVYGAYDLILHNYGPDSYNGSVHIEVPDTLSADDIDTLTRKITAEVYAKHGVILTAISVYSRNTKNTRAAQIRDEVYALAMSHDYVMQTHGFYLDEEHKVIRFDVLVSFDAPDRRAVFDHIIGDVRNAYPEYTPVVAMDTDFSEPEKEQ